VEVQVHSFVTLAPEKGDWTGSYSRDTAQGTHWIGC